MAKKFKLPFKVFKQEPPVEGFDDELGLATLTFGDSDVYVVIDDSTGARMRRDDWKALSEKDRKKSLERVKQFSKG